MTFKLNAVKYIPFKANYDVVGVGGEGYDCGGSGVRLW